MPYKNAMGQTYDSGAVRADPRPGRWRSPTGTASRRAAPTSKRARQAARPRHRDLPRMDRRQRVRGDGDVDVTGRRHHRDLLGDAGDGPGHRDQLRAARGRRVRRADREDPHRAGRHRPRQRLRQRRLALAVHRRLGGARRVRAHRRARARSSPPRRSRRRRPTSSTAPAASRVAGTDRRHRPVRARRQAAASSASISTRPAPSAAPTWPNALPRLRGRDRPRDRRRRRRRLRVGQRHRPHRQPDDRRAARSKAARCRASARRCASRSSTTRDSGQLLTGELHGLRDAARRHRRRAFKTEFDDLDAVPDQPARRQGRRRARHDRRDAGGVNAVVDALDHAGLGRDAERCRCR